MRPRSHRFRLAAALLMASAVSAACFVSVAPPVQAGPNAGGTLILHYGGDALGDGVCSFVNDPWCLDECWNSPEDCDSVIPAQPGDGWIHAMVFVLAAFPESSSPRLASVSFGVESPSPFEPYLDAWDPCPGTESPTENWPASGTGTTVTLAEVGTSSLVRIYAFAGYTEYGNPFEFVLTPHPTEGGVFRDDSVPPVIDEITDYGRFGFAGASGYVPCPVDPVPVEAVSWGATKGRFRP